MSYNRHQLSALGYSNGFTLWHYRSPDQPASGDEYFNQAANMLKTGDFIFCNMGVGTENPSHYMLVVVDVDTKDKIVYIETLSAIKKG